MTELQWMDIYGDNLKQMLDEACMTQEELAYSIGVSQSMISRYINKRSMPPLKVALNIYHVLSKEFVRCDDSDLFYFFDRIH